MTSPHLGGVPHIYVVTLSKFTHVTYGLTLLASRQHRWSTSLPTTAIPAHIPDTFKTSLLHQFTTDTRTNTDKPVHAKDTCTVNILNFVDRSALSSLNLFGATAILAMHKHLTEVEHINQNLSATNVDQLSLPTQALLWAVDAVQHVTRWELDAKLITMVFTPTPLNYNPLRKRAQ
jgi:hypothetical protein